VSAEIEVLREARRAAEQARFDDCEQMVRSVLAQSPADVGAWLLLAQTLLNQNRSDAVLAATQSALQLAPLSAQAYYLEGRAYKVKGDLIAATRSYRRAAAVSAEGEQSLLADILTSLGVALRVLGRPDESAASYAFALGVLPAHVAARTNLERHRASLDHAWPAKSERLIKVLEQQIQLDAAEIAAHLIATGRVTDAMHLMRRVLTRHQRPGVPLLVSAAQVAAAAGKYGGALQLFDQVLEADPGNLYALESARAIAVVLGLRERVVRHSQALLELAPSDEVRVGLRLTLPAVHASAASIRQTRREYEAALDDLLGAGLRIDNPIAATGVASFFLAYHGENDRLLQTKSAKLFAEASPSISFQAPHCRARRTPGRIRVGFICRFFYEHSIGRTSRGLIEKLDRNELEVVVIRLEPSPADAMTAALRAAADQFVDVSTERGFEHAQREIAALKLDILFYQEIGMHAFTYFLAFARLAPVQCVSYGHPNTTGIPNVDYFISNDLYELQDSADHYSERLFLLRSLPTLAYYYRPEAGPALTRADLGLPADATLYICPQTLFKLHPDMDPLLGQILEADPRGQLILIRGDHYEWNDALKSRFAQSMPRVTDRVVFLESLPWSRFMQVLRSSDVMLDTLHFNGMNSSLEAFAVGLPVVTLPGRLQRGRHTRAMYLKMGISDCIADSAESYVQIAVHLGTDEPYRRSMRERILQANSALYEDVRVVQEFERFFRLAVAELSA
jgi:protein O-GlcNAc transferase